MARTQSRYQRGLSYEPGMAESRYRPTRATADLGTIGDYGGVTPIPGDPGGGGVAPTAFEGSGNGLGDGTNMLAGLALSALSNPRVSDYLLRQVRGSDTAAMVSGRPLDGAMTYERLTGLPTGDGGGVTIEPMAPTTQNGVTFRELGTQQGGNALSGAARVLDNSLTYEQLMGLPFRPDPGVTIAPMSPTTGAGGVQFREVPWPDGGASGTDGGVSGLDFGVMDGAEGAGGFGSWLSGLQGTAFTPGATGIEGVLGSGLLGGGFDWLGGAATLGAGALGNWVASQAPYEGRRDPMGKNIGAGLGSAVGGLFLGPMGAFLGAQLGGAIGGQFGPMATVGPNWSTLYAYQPTASGEWQNWANSENPIAPGQQFTLDGQWSSHTGADNGGQANPAFSDAFQQALQAYAQQQGYAINPGSIWDGYFVGNYSGGPNANGTGYFYAPMAFPDQQVFFGNDLAAPYQGRGLGGQGAGSTYGDAMLQYAFKDLVNQGLYVPQGQAMTPEQAQQSLWDMTNQQNLHGAELRVLNNVGAPGN